MARKLNPREKRILVVGIAAAVAIVALNYGPKAIGHWQEVRAQLKALQSKMRELGPSDSALQAALLAMVPKFEAPQPEEKQKFLFRDELGKQLRSAGIKTEPLTILTSRRTVGPYKTLSMKCKGKCRFDQLLDFLAALKENPYLVGLEELRIQCDTKQRQDVEIDLAGSTFIQGGAIHGVALKEQP